MPLFIAAANMQRSFPIACLCTTIMLAHSVQGQAATAAGTVLTNVAKVTYEDAAGNSYEAESNEALVTVAQVYSASLSQDDLTATGAAGQTVYMTHTLRNDGNGTDTYHLTVDQFAGTDGIDFTAIAVYQDGGINGIGANGQVDGAETLLANLSGEQATVTLGPGEFVELVVALSVPTGAGSADTAEYTLTAEAEQGTGSAV
ncbi:MAG: hypothetical protein OEY72_08230, partial [Gammaproteobacteria bacterium]|nr:hypothetical protein [Gammaproteobacteria bacterium]